MYHTSIRTEPNRTRSLLFCVMKTLKGVLLRERYFLNRLSIGTLSEYKMVKYRVR